MASGPCCCSGVVCPPPNAEPAAAAVRPDAAGVVNRAAWSAAARAGIGVVSGSAAAPGLGRPRAGVTALLPPAPSSAASTALAPLPPGALAAAGWPCARGGAGVLRAAAAACWLAAVSLMLKRGFFFDVMGCRGVLRPAAAGVLLGRPLPCCCWRRLLPVAAGGGPGWWWWPAACCGGAPEEPCSKAARGLLLRLIAGSLAACTCCGSTHTHTATHTEAGRQA